MKKAYILLDRSGSMASVWDASIDGINNYVTEIGEADAMLAAFDSTGYDVIRNVAVKKWIPVGKTEVYPRGGTPLLDAAGRIMWTMTDENPDLAVLVIVTDGFENSSVKFKAEEIRRYTADFRDRKKYEIVFLGANFDGIKDVAARSFGVVDSSRYMASGGTYNEVNTAFSSTATASAAYFKTGNRAENFYSETDKANAKTPPSGSAGGSASE